MVRVARSESHKQLIIERQRAEIMEQDQGKSTTTAPVANASVSNVLPSTTLTVAAAATNNNNNNVEPTFESITIHQQGPLGMTISGHNIGGVVDESWVSIDKITPNSSAYHAGVRPGDVPMIFQIDEKGRTLHKRISYKDFLSMARGGIRPMEFSVLRRAIVNSSSEDNGDTKQPAVAAVSSSSSSSSSSVQALATTSSKFATWRNNVKKENVVNETAVATSSGGLSSGGEVSVSKETSAAATPLPLPSNLTALLAMSNQQLHEELNLRDIKVRKNATKDVMLEKLGVPVTQWRAYRKMKVVELKDILKKQGKHVTGRKDQLLERLGVPLGFGETASETFDRECKERERVRKKQKKEQEKKQQEMQQIPSLPTLPVSQAILFTLAAATAAAANDLNNYDESTEDDPTHKNYVQPCCDEPKFAKWGENKPAGAIYHRDGGVTEVARWYEVYFLCFLVSSFLHVQNLHSHSTFAYSLACGKIPARPNADAPIVEFESDDEEDYGRFNDHRVGGVPQPDCVIQ